jgi:hypothetical protein
MNERAEFIGAPDTNAKKNMSKSITAPITIPKPLKPFVKTKIKITAISKAEAYDLLIVTRHN